MKNEKPKFVEIIMGVAGCHSQISKKEDYAFNPIRVMEKKGFLPEIWTLIKKGKPKEEYIMGVKIRRFSNIFSLLLNLLFDRRVKLVYAQLRPYLPSLLSPLSLKKCILITQTYELGSTPFIRRFSLFFMNRFAKIFALTPYERKEYIKNGLRKDRVIFFPHAIDHSFFSKKPKRDLSKIRKEYGISKNDFVVATIANFRKFKNLDIMVSAFALFHEKVRNSKMLVVGKDLTKSKHYREQESKRYSEVEDVGTVVKKEKLSKDVIFTGGINYKKVREILHISDIFVNISDPEGMGMAVYEAASAGVPLCLSNIGSFTSVFKNIALYSPPRDKKRLAENYLRYYNNPLLRKKVGKELKQYLKKWDYSAAMGKFDKIFSEILDRP